MKMLKRLFLYILLCMTGTQNVSALTANAKNDLIAVNIVPQYQTLSTKDENLTIITSVEIKPDWHIYWHNPGDSGDPTVLTYMDSPDYTIKDQIHSAPQKSVFEDIITTYIHRNKLYFKTEFKLNDISNKKNLPFKQILSYTICKKECLPGTISAEIDIPVNNIRQENSLFLNTLLEAENTFPIPLSIVSHLQNEQIELHLPDTVLQECDTPEFVSWYTKKDILSNLPVTHLSSDGTLHISFDKGETPPDTKGILLCKNRSYDIKSAKNIEPYSPSLPQRGATTYYGLTIYYLLTAFLAGLILNLMPCVLPILSLKALHLASHKNKASPLSALIYMIGVLSSFLLLSAILFYFKSFGTEMGWGFQLQSPAFNIFLMLLFFIIFLNLIDKMPLSDKFADKLTKIADNSNFLTGFFAVIIACPCTGPFMGAALGYAVLQPPLIYFSIFLSLGFGYALPYVLIEAYPAFFLKFIPKPGHWMITLKHILSIPIALTCLWLTWIIYHQLSPKPSQEILWKQYDKNAITAALENKEPVFIDFTAKWCLVCLLNDKTTLNTKQFADLIRERNIKLYKADWTNRSKEIAEALKTYNRNSIPLYIYYKEGSRQPIYLPQILTTDILQKKLK